MDLGILAKELTQDSFFLFTSCKYIYSTVNKFVFYRKKGKDNIIEQNIPSK
jgi:hypothetical protein